METGQLTVFNLGQSTVITLPKKWGIKPGTKIKYRKSPQKVNLELADNQTKKNLEYVRKHAGCLKYKAKAPFPTLKEMSDAYEKDTYGDVLPGY